MSYAIEQFEEIRRRQEEIRAELDLALKGTSAPVSEEPKVYPMYCYTAEDYDSA